MSSYKLPPVRHLPQWSRVGRLGKPRSPRCLPANQLQPLPVVPPVEREAGRAAEKSCHNDMDPRVASMQKNIQFLQKQHKETLERLHAEVEYLRRENKGERNQCNGKMSCMFENERIFPCNVVLQRFLQFCLWVFSVTIWDHLKYLSFFYDWTRDHWSSSCCFAWLAT